MNNDIVIFRNGELELEVSVSEDRETVWLTQKQIAELFGKDRRTITRHIQNVYKDNELEQDSVCSFFVHTGSDGKNYKVQFYNLDMILAVGYRVKSPNGIVFRKWATSILKDYIFLLESIATTMHIFVFDSPLGCFSLLFDSNT